MSITNFTFSQKKDKKETVVETLDDELALVDGETKAEPEGEDAADDKPEPEEETEDVKDAEEGAKGEAADSQVKAKIPEEVKEEEDKNDYTLLDMLINGFLSQKTERLPILCGYFNKVL